MKPWLRSLGVSILQFAVCVAEAVVVFLPVACDLNGQELRADTCKPKVQLAFHLMSQSGEPDNSTVKKCKRDVMHNLHLANYLCLNLWERNNALSYLCLNLWERKKTLKKQKVRKKRKKGWTAISSCDKGCLINVSHYYLSSYVSILHWSESRLPALPSHLDSKTPMSHAQPARFFLQPFHCFDCQCVTTLCLLQSKCWKCAHCVVLSH